MFVESVPASGSNKEKDWLANDDFSDVNSQQLGMDVLYLFNRRYLRKSKPA